MTVRKSAYLSSSQFTYIRLKGIEPRHRQNVRVDPLMDLEATQEDHPEVCFAQSIGSPSPIEIYSFRQGMKKM